MIEQHPHDFAMPPVGRLVERGPGRPASGRYQNIPFSPVLQHSAAASFSP